MDNLQIKAILAGLFFGIYPLFLNKSGLAGNVSAMLFSGVVFVFVTPFAISELGSMTNIRWTMLLCGGLFGAIGVMCFNGALAKVAPQSIGTLIVIMVLVQISIPAVYQSIAEGTVSLTKVVGFALAAIAAVLLTKG